MRRSRCGKPRSSCNTEAGAGEFTAVNPHCSLAGVLCVGVLAAVAPQLAAQSSPIPAKTPLPAAATAAFVPNVGQWEHAAPFVARVPGGAAFFENDGFWLRLVAVHEEPLPPKLRGHRPTTLSAIGVALKWRFVGGAAVDPRSESRAAGVHNYFVGSDPDHWRTGVPVYDGVRYAKAYEGVDIRCYSLDGHLEYDVELAPHADLGAVTIAVQGADRMSIDERGALVLDTAAGVVRQPAPVAYAVDAKGARRAVVCHYELRGTDSFGFAAPGWNGEERLVIDPGVLYSAVFGGVAATATGPIPADLEQDAQGLATLAGFCEQLAYPTTAGAFQPTFGGGVYDLFVTQLDPSQPTAQQHVYTTYLGGTGDESPPSIQLVPGGLVAVVSWTTSLDFPLSANAFQSTRAGSTDCTVTLLDPSAPGAAQLAYSTYLGGGNDDLAEAVAVSVNGDLVVTGFSDSTNFPVTPGAFDNTPGGAGSAFVAALNPFLPAAQQLVYSTYLGGNSSTSSNGSDDGRAIAIDDLGRYVVGGYAESQSFPTTIGALQPTTASPFLAECFVSILDPLLVGSNQLVYSTLFGGNGDEWVEAFVVDPATDVVTFCGATTSDNLLTTAGAFQQNSVQPAGTFFGGFAGRLDPFAPGVQQLQYCTYVVGDTLEFFFDIATDANGFITTVGYTQSSDYPTTGGAYGSTFTGQFQMGVLTQLDPSLLGANQLLYSTLLGSDSTGFAVALDANDSRIATVFGSAGTGHPTTPGAFSSPSGSSEMFLTKVDMRPTGVFAYGTATPGCDGAASIGVRSWPQVGDNAFAFTCHGAPASSVGIFVTNFAPLVPPVSVIGIDLWVNPINASLLLVATDAAGVAVQPFAIPAVPPLAGLFFYTQFVLYDVPAVPQPSCPPLGWSASNAVWITVQP